jgi:peptide/nickel transport system substrate-binding protein
MSMRKERATIGFCMLAALLTVAIAASMTSTSAVAQKSAGAVAYPRSQTLYTGGTQWGNIVGFNPYVGNYATGMVGLVNETLFRYDPLADKYIPWLAKGGTWTSAKVYAVTVRSGIKWSDGSAFTASDVKWNFDLGRFATAPWHNLYTGLKGVTVAGNVVTFTFYGTPHYQQWQNQLWNIPMVQPDQWKDHANANDLPSWSPSDPIGTGPYVLDRSGYDPTTRVVWKKNPNGWWAAKAGLSPNPKPTYIIDLVNSSNNVALSLVINGQEDLNNNYLPGIVSLLKGGYGLQTYFAKAPYMLSANTAWLLPNLTKKPLNDVRFRRALATSIDIKQIVSVDYAQMVRKASPSGLLPTWSKYINKGLVAKYGFSYSTSRAKSMLAAAGYRDRNHDGYVESPTGAKISLKLAGPAGWSDWMQAIQMISQSAKKAGIRITPSFPDFNAWQTARNTGKFDLVIDNTAQLSDTPYTYYQYLYNLPVLSSQTNYNFERYQNPKAWKLVQKLDRTPKTNTAAMKSIIDQLQQVTMQQMPEIPLWYNGVWSQYSNQVWKNWPSATGKRHYLPAMWRNYLQMTGIDTITHLTPAGD